MKTTTRLYSYPTLEKLRKRAMINYFEGWILTLKMELGKRIYLSSLNFPSSKYKAKV
jgi:hypothetical protein